MHYNMVPRVHNKEESVQLPYTLSKMSPLSISVHVSKILDILQMLNNLHRHLIYMVPVQPHLSHVNTWLIEVSTVVLDYRYYVTRLIRCDRP